MKDHLRTRGVEFDAINIQEDPDAADQLGRRGIHALPVVAVGERYEVGFDLGVVDSLIGQAARTQPELDFQDMVATAAYLLRAAWRYGAQLPYDHHDDVIPGLEDVTVPLMLPGGIPLLLPDGTPYVPHRTALGLLRHIIGHGRKFLTVCAQPDLDYRDVGWYAQLGEPNEDLPVEHLGSQLGVLVTAIESCAGRTTPELERPIETFFGRQTVHQMLRSNVYSLGQHTRQLMTLVGDLGIEPDERLDPAVLEPLELPSRPWD